MKVIYLLTVIATLLWTRSEAQQIQAENDYPEGYYAFQEAPGKVPPKVRKPPYVQSKIPCLGTLESKEEMEQSLNNLCGDLNDGRLPLNPMGQNVMGHSYPFDLIKNMSLDFFSKTLPILKDDPTLPKVAKFRSMNVPLRGNIRRPVRSVENKEGESTASASSSSPFSSPVARSSSRSFSFASATEIKDLEIPKKVVENDVEKVEQTPEGRSLGSAKTVEGRGARAFCDDNWGLFCLLYNTMSGKSSSSSAQNRNDGHNDLDSALNSLGGSGGGMQPLTPCPSAVEYITPVFARNYQGMWRYVVQIPYEGYFTQTVEVTQCLTTKCHYLAGACLASPRWVSLLVAEIYYPDAVFPASGQRPDFSRAAVSSDNHPNAPLGTNFFNLQRRQGSKDPPSSQYCDGHDEIGCFQVRLYYDWFLIPGSCKCWKQDYFAQFAYRKK